MIATVINFLSNWRNLLAVALVYAFVFVAITAPDLAPPDDPAQAGPYRRTSTSMAKMPEPPQPGLWLGSTPAHLDVYYSLIWGTRSALRFGLVTTLITAVLGVTLGAVSGYNGGFTRRVIMGVTDSFLAFPPIAAIWLLNIVMLPSRTVLAPTELQQLLAQLNITPVMVALILFSWMPYARITNAAVQTLKGMPFLEAAHAMGGNRLHILFRHVIPNTISSAIILAAKDVGGMVVLQAAFSFIGFGGDSVWGTLLASSRSWIIGIGGNVLTYWWIFLPTTLTLILFGIAWNLLGDGLVEFLNPRSNGPMRNQKSF
jgi:peptide/nickel transport system permease protein